MIIRYVTRFLLSALVVGALCGSAAEAQDSPSDLATAIKEVKQAEMDLSKKKGAERVATFSDKFMDVHGSGWLYTLGESDEMTANLAKGNPGFKTIKTETSEERFVAFSRDAVVISRITTSYHEEPNPQDVARKAGTMTDDPVAIARATKLRPVPPPGETEDYSNPSRTRRNTLWLRINGHWLLCMSTATRVGLKQNGGRF